MRKGGEKPLHHREEEDVKNEGDEDPLGEASVEAQAQVEIDLASNPFPKTYTVNGFSGSARGELRHTGGVIVSFVDGHVKLLRGKDLRQASTMYNIPYSGWRIAIDFATCKDAADAKNRLNLGAYFPSGAPSLWNPGTKTWDLSAGERIVFDGGGIYDGTQYTKFTCGASDSMMMEGTLSADAVTNFGCAGRQYSVMSVCGSIVFPLSNATPDTLAENAIETCYYLDNTAGKIQFGQLYGFTLSTLYTQHMNEWIDLPTIMKGRVDTIPTVSDFKVMVSVDYHGWLPSFPGDPSHGTYWELYTYNPYGFVNHDIWVGQQTVEFRTPTNTLRYDGPMLSSQYNPENYEHNIDVLAGSLKIKKLFFTSGDAGREM